MEAQQNADCIPLPLTHAHTQVCSAAACLVLGYGHYIHMSLQAQPRKLVSTEAQSPGASVCHPPIGGAESEGLGHWVLLHMGLPACHGVRVKKGDTLTPPTRNANRYKGDLNPNPRTTLIVKGNRQLSVYVRRQLPPLNTALVKQLVAPGMARKPRLGLWHWSMQT